MFTFKAIGTQWNIDSSGFPLTEEIKEKIVADVAVFEQRFSRFLPDSEVNQFSNSKAGTYSISAEFAHLLQKTDRLRELTNGRHDPSIAELLEKAGYDKNYSLKEKAGVEEFKLPRWSLNGTELTIDGPVKFDLGATGKGYCIDLVVNILTEANYKHFLVDAGGDMYGTTKAAGSAWHIAIEYPGQPDLAAGTIDLKHQALAVSDNFRRAWGKWHHIIDPEARASVDNIIGAVAVSKNTWHADCMTSALYLGNESDYQAIAKEFEAEYLVFKADDSCVVSKNWSGVLFK